MAGIKILIGYLKPSQQKYQKYKTWKSFHHQFVECYNGIQANYAASLQKYETETIPIYDGALKYNWQLQAFSDVKPDDSNLGWCIKI